MSNAAMKFTKEGLLNIIQTLEMQYDKMCEEKTVHLRVAEESNRSTLRRLAENQREIDRLHQTLNTEKNCFELYIKNAETKITQLEKDLAASKAREVPLLLVKKPRTKAVKNDRL